VEQVVRDYQRENSDLTADEIRTALLHSTENYEDEGALTRRRLRAILTVVAAAVIAGLAVMTDSGARGEGGSGSAGIAWKVVAGTVAAVAIVIAVLRIVNRR
jgi:NADH:ubiquinone oxidoreductase subunit F (NADH-binding)